MHPKSKYKISQKKIEDCNFRRWLPKEDVRSDLKLTIYKIKTDRKSSNERYKIFDQKYGYYTKKNFNKLL